MKYPILISALIGVSLVGEVSAIEVSKPSAPTTQFLEKMPEKPASANLEKKVDTEVAIDKQNLSVLNPQLDFYTDNVEWLEQATELEEFFYKNFDDFRKNTSLYAMSIGKSDDDRDKIFANQTYGGLTGLRLYHHYDEFFALARMIRLSAVVNPDHTSTYIDMALEYIHEYVPKLVSGHGTKYCGTAKSRYYCNASPPRHKFLDATRGMAWLGYLMDSILMVESSYKEQFSGYANDMRPILDNHVSHAYKTTHIHMATHVGFAADLLGRLGGFQADYFDEINAVINDALIGNIKKSKWITSDVGHAEMSANYMHYVYEQQQRGNVIPGQELVTMAHFETIGKTFISKRWDDHPTAFRFTETNIGEYALLARGSSVVADVAVAPSKYKLVSPTGTHRLTETLSTVASFAYGLAFD